MRIGTVRPEEAKIDAIKREQAQLCTECGHRNRVHNGRCYAYMYACWTPDPGDDTRYALERCQEHAGQHYRVSAGLCDCNGWMP